jgi:hypothetical protein
MSTFATDAGFQSVCYHAAGSIFIIGVIEETALNAAIRRRMAAPGESSQITVIVKNAL